MSRNTADEAVTEVLRCFIIDCVGQVSFVRYLKVDPVDIMDDVVLL
jgi:hypothetical protein